MGGVWWRALWLVILAVALVAGLWFSPARGVERSAGLDALYSLRGVRTPPQKVLIVALDAAVAQRLGVPARPDLWPRSLHARLVDGLARSGAVAVGFDLLFERPGDERDDAALAAALARAGNVVLAERVVRNPLRDEAGALLGSVDRLIRPLPALVDAAWSTAPFVLPKTADGVFEFWIAPGGAGGHASMPVRLFERWREERGEGGDLPVGPRARLGLNLYGPFGTVPLIPYDEALRRLDAPGGDGAFAGALVLVGLAEPNQSLQFDVYQTPFSRADGVDISGVELAATALANLIEGSALSRLSEPRAAVLVIGWTLLLALPWALARAAAAAIATALALLAYAALAMHSFTQDFLWLPVVFPLVVAPLAVAGTGLAFKYRHARARHRRLQRLLARGGAGALERLAGGLEARRHGRVVRAVCLCSDIAAYTTLAEGRSAAEARDLLNRYLALFLPLVESFGGDVTDMVGDSIMSLWVVGPDPGDACRRALAAARALDARMNREQPAGALPTRFGLHLGEVFFGEVGAGERTEIRPVGDVVNTASRIQDACKPLGLTLLASEAITTHAQELATCKVGRFLLKGKSDPMVLIALDEALCGADAGTLFADALARFADGDARGARSAFHDLLARAPGHGPARFYAGLCAAPSLPEAGTVVLGQR